MDLSSKVSERHESLLKIDDQMPKTSRHTTQHRNPFIFNTQSTPSMVHLPTTDLNPACPTVTRLPFRSVYAKYGYFKS
jgi:hypothetical protein